MSTHPYLADPERASAFLYLCQNPVASERTWATALHWTPSKVHRFIARLIELGFAETIATPWGTRFQPKPSAAVFAAAAPKQDRSRVAARVQQDCSKTEAPHLEAVALDVLETGSSCEEARETAEGLTCIAIANEVLCSNFKDFNPIKHDNLGSHRAVLAWMAAGMSLADMTRLVREKSAAFHPKYLQRDPYPFPKTLGYFTSWILKTWGIERRQLRLPLMVVDRSATKEATIAPDVPKEPTAAGETITAVMEDVARTIGILP